MGHISTREGSKPHVSRRTFLCAFDEGVQIPLRAIRVAVGIIGEKSLLRNGQGHNGCVKLRRAREGSAGRLVPISVVRPDVGSFPALNSSESPAVRYGLR